MTRMIRDGIWNSADNYVDQGSEESASVHRALGLQPDIVNDVDRTPPGLRTIHTVRAL